MRYAAFDRLAPSAPGHHLPLAIEQSCNRISSLTKLSLLVLLLSLMAAAFGLVLAHVAEEPALRAQLAERPMAVVQIALGLVGWMALFAWPANRLMGKLVARRRVVIDMKMVHVSERTLLGRRSWTAPLSTFDGLAHHVRTSLSGARHELILVHPDRKRSVLLAIADRIDKAELDNMAKLLGVAELPAGALYKTARSVPAADMPIGQLRPAT